MNLKKWERTITTVIISNRIDRYNQLINGEVHYATKLLERTARFEPGTPTLRRRG